MSAEEVKLDLKFIFENDRVRIAGTVEDPLFVAGDIAREIGDQNNVYRYMKESAYENDWTIIRGADGTGRREQEMYVFTEIGLYRYLARSNLPRAIQFQNEVFNIVKGLRKKIVDNAKLREKIANDVIGRLKQDVAKLEDKEKYYVDNYHNDYVKQPDHEFKQMADHYMNMFIYEYKYRFPSEPRNVNLNTMMLPADFTLDDIPFEVKCEIYSAADKYFAKNDVDKMQTLAYRLLKPFLIPRAE